MPVTAIVSRKLGGLFAEPDRQTRYLPCTAWPRAGPAPSRPGNRLPERGANGPAGGRPQPAAARTA